MNAVELGFPKAVAMAHSSRPKKYVDAYAMVQSIEQKLRGSGPDIDYHSEKKRDMMNQMMNKFKDAKQIQTHQSQFGTSVRTVPYAGYKMNMPLNMVTVCNDKPFSGGSLRFENQKLGKDLLAKRAKQLGEQQMAVEGSVVPTTAEMEQRMMGPTDAEIEKAISAPSDLAMDEIVMNYDLLLDGLEQGLIGLGSFDYVKRIVLLIKKHAIILSRSDFTKLDEYNDDALEYVRAVISKKFSNIYNEYELEEQNARIAGRTIPTVETFNEQRKATEFALESALERLKELLTKLSKVALIDKGPRSLTTGLSTGLTMSEFASEKERKLAIASTLREAGLESLKEPKAKRKEAKKERVKRLFTPEQLAEIEARRQEQAMMMAQPEDE
jgi:hypothetical protein